MRWRGQRVTADRMALPAVAVAELFGAKQRLVIGRAPDCDVCLPHPLVSRYHALLERRAEGLFLRDLTSINGVWVGGKRVGETVQVGEGQRVGIGPFLFTLTGGVIRALDSSRNLRLEARGLDKVITLSRGNTRKLLDNIDLVVEPGEFVSVLGPSGSGKSTLMDCLNGRRRATGGMVLANGEDFYTHFDSFRQSLGYVPQKDIVHTGLSVYRALFYTAKLRLPTDTDRDELEARIEEVLGQMELGPHRDTLVSNLSGGQIKRVSLGAELLGQPCLLFIDEATSGLDAGTEARMMRLFRRLSDEGRSVLCITHNLENVEQCHLIVVLARGKLIYYGPPQEAPGYFGVERISEIYDRIMQLEVNQWERRFLSSAFHEQYVIKRLVPWETTVQTPAPQTDPVPLPAPLSDTSMEEEPEDEPSGRAGQWFSNLLADGRRLVALSQLPPLADKFRQWKASALNFAPIMERLHQFHVLVTRYVELILKDGRSLRLLMLQAPIVACFLLLGFFDKNYQERIPVPRPLSESERKVLQAFQAAHRSEVQPGSPQKLSDERIEELSKIKVKVPFRGEQFEMTGAELAVLLNQLDHLTQGNEMRQAVDDMRFTFESGGQPVTLTRADLVQAYTQLDESGLPRKMLAYQGPIVPDSEMINPRYTYMLSFIVVMIVMWFGTNNAAKEIVKEEAIYSRERAVNLHILPYLASKFLILTLITAMHAALLMLVLYGTLHLLHAYFPGEYSVPPAVYMLDYLQQFLVLTILGMAAVALGLFLSACVSSPDRANALLPYVLIPQMILGGGLLNVKDGSLFYLAAAVSPVYWGYRAVHQGAQVIPAQFPGHVDYPDSITLPCQALLLQTLVLLLLTAWCLKRKDVATG